MGRDYTDWEEKRSWGDVVRTYRHGIDKQLLLMMVKYLRITVIGKVIWWFKFGTYFSNGFTWRPFRVRDLLFARTGVLVKLLFVS
jgi:hypothetical protein